MLKKIILRTFIITMLILLVGSFTLLSNFSQAQVNRKQITIGYFPNVTHAPAIIGIKEKIYKNTLGDIEIKTRIFPNGSLLMNALSTEQIDFGYVGPGPAINRFLQGANVKALASASTGGTVLVTSKDFDYKEPQDLKGKIVATAALGCTHDLLFRKLIRKHNLKTIRKGGNIDHRAQKPATMIGLFATDQLDAAMVSEPWAARMENKIEAKVAVNWNQVPWQGKLPATIVVTRSNFIEENPELVNDFLKFHLQSVKFIENNPEKAYKITRQEISRITKQDLSIDVIKRSFVRTNFTTNLDVKVVQELANLSAELDFIKGNSDLEGFFQTDFMEEIINENSQ